jgi:hypothetical protein
MSIKYFISGFVLTAVLLISCKKNDSNDSNNYIKLDGYYTALCSNSKNEIIIMGYDKTELDTSLIILKTDMKGNRVWERRYVTEYGTIARRILVTGDDEYFVAADRVIGKNYITYGYENLLIKFDDNGDTLYQTLLEKSDNLFVSSIAFSRDNGVIVLLVPKYGIYAELIDVSAAGQILTKTPLDLHGDNYQIGEYPMGYRYLMYDCRNFPDSLRLNLCQLEVSGEIISCYRLTRQSLPGTACFSSEEQNIFWLSSDVQGIKMTKTDFANNIILEKVFQFSDSEKAYPEGIETIGGSKYAFGNYHPINKDNSSFFVMKFNDQGDMEKLFLTALASSSPYTYSFTGLNNGSLALIHPVDDGIEGGCYALRIYN